MSLSLSSCREFSITLRLQITGVRVGVLGWRCKGGGVSVGVLGLSSGG